MRTNMVVYLGEPATVHVGVWEAADFSGIPVLQETNGVTHIEFENDDIVLRFDLLDPHKSSMEVRYPADRCRVFNVYR